MSLSVTVFLLRLNILCTSNWSIHGLWPEQREYCHKVPFNYSALSPILTELDSHWKSCYETNEKFWSHEWKKHGTCSNMSEYEYFNRGLSLFYQYRNNCTNKDSKECNLCFGHDYEPVECHN